MKKLFLCIKVIYNNKKIKTISYYFQHLVMIDEIFSIPPSLKGDIIECGCFNGASTVNLSHACELTNRRLFVCDSFEGLPEPNDEEKYDVHAHFNDYYLWEKGEFSSEAGLEGVKHTIEKYGRIEVCEFIKGYFKDTLQNIPTDSIVMIFEDADVPSSVEDCILYLWPKLQYGCKFYCHEPWSPLVVGLFYDKKLWGNYFNEQIPGFYGSGDGVRVGSRYLKMGYTIKYDPEKIIKEGQKRIHLGSKGFAN